MKMIRIFAIILVAAGIALVIFDSSEGAEIPLLTGLFLLLIVKSKGHDERLLSLKTSSVYLAVIAGYSIKLISSNLYSHDIIQWQLTEINYFLILVFAIALLIYHSRLYFTSH